MDFKDYYATLGVAKTASDKEIKQAFRKLARKYHPDVNPGDKAAEARFKEINEANEVLGDPEKREEVRRAGRELARSTSRRSAPASRLRRRPVRRPVDLCHRAAAAVPPDDRRRGLRDVRRRRRARSPTSSGRSSAAADRAATDAARAVARRARKRAVTSSTRSSSIWSTRCTAACSGSASSTTASSATSRCGFPRASARDRACASPARASAGRGGGAAAICTCESSCGRTRSSSARAAILDEGARAAHDGRARRRSGRADARRQVASAEDSAGTQNGQVFRLRGHGLPTTKKDDGGGDLYATVDVALPKTLSDEERTHYEALAKLEKKSS